MNERVLRRVIVRFAAFFGEWNVHPRSPECSQEAKDAVAALLGAIRLEWARERREMGL